MSARPRPDLHGVTHARKNILSAPRWTEKEFWQEYKKMWPEGQKENISVSPGALLASQLSCQLHRGVSGYLGESWAGRKSVFDFYQLHRIIQFSCCLFHCIEKATIKVNVSTRKFTNLISNFSHFYLISLFIWDSNIFYNWIFCCCAKPLFVFSSEKRILNKRMVCMVFQACAAQWSNSLTIILRFCFWKLQVHIFLDANPFFRMITFSEMLCHRKDFLLNRF